MPGASSRLRLCLLALAAAPPPALACTSRAGDTAVSDRKQENSKNPFKVQLERRFKFRNFDPPQKVLYGFKPVNILKTFLDDVPGPPYEDKVALEKADVEELLHAEENFPPRKFINMDLHNNIKENYKPKEFMTLDQNNNIKENYQPQQFMIVDSHIESIKDERGYREEDISQSRNDEIDEYGYDYDIFGPSSVFDGFPNFESFKIK